MGASWAATETGSHCRHVSSRDAYATSTFCKRLAPRGAHAREAYPRCDDREDRGAGGLRIAFRESHARDYLLSSFTCGFVGRDRDGVARAAAAGVRYPPGFTIVTEMPKPRTSPARASLHPLERPLRSAVDGEVRNRGDARDGRDLDDVTRGLRQEGQRGLGHPERTEEVGVELAPRLLRRHLLHGAVCPKPALLMTTSSRPKCA